MKWIEMIQLRSFSEEEKHRALEAFRPEKFAGLSKGIESVRLLLRVGPESDMGISIHWDTADTMPGKSSIGFQIAEAFSGFGMVLHSLWTITEDYLQTKPTEKVQDH